MHIKLPRKRWGYDGERRHMGLSLLAAKTAFAVGRSSLVVRVQNVVGALPGIALMDQVA